MVFEIIEQPKEVFFKDEGGKSNFLRCRCKYSHIYLKKLSVEVIYENGEQIPNNLLSKYFISNKVINNNILTINFRFDIVSKNLNNNAFKLKITDCNESIITDSFLIKSKRQKRKRELDEGSYSENGNKNLHKTINNLQKTVNHLQKTVNDLQLIIQDVIIIRPFDISN